MPRIKITNPRNVIEAPIKKNYFKIRATSGPKGDKGDTGATGPQGPQGPQGNAATIYVGSTTTLPVGQDATVENVGSQYAAVLNFGIPQGPQGPQGAKGDKGDKGDKGEQGNTGNTGPAGQNATVYIGTTTTGAPGSQASVYNSGTENNAVLNFTIPQGTKGDTGATGATGATGPQGPAGQDGQDGKDFAPSVVESLPAVGDESKLYLTPKAHTTQTATGNPITATITDGAGQIEDFQLDGDTYQQSYTGKNLCRITLPNISGACTVVYSDNTISLNGARGTGNLQNTSNIGTTLVAGTYTVRAFLLSGSASGNGTRLIMRIGNNNFTVRSDISGASEPLSVTLDSDTDVTLQIWVDNSTTYNNLKIGYQIEAGSTATSFEPFVGGIASPNPSYPQPIQVVTGEQTVSINGTNYPISLGSIELCKLGTYQDYIYKDGDDWKVHKATEKYVFNTSITDGLSRQNFGYVYNATNNPLVGKNTPMAGFCSHFTVEDTTTTWTGAGRVGMNSLGALWFMTTNTSGGDTRTYQEFADWLSINKVAVYYALATATDTEITDSTLISQLNAIASASLENGTNTLTNSATGSNLAGDMEVGYYGYDPTNRYDKWLWLDINNAYEKLGS